MVPPDFLGYLRQRRAVTGEWALTSISTRRLADAGGLCTPKGSNHLEQYFQSRGTPGWIRTNDSRLRRTLL
jgi:hypothetical protein